MKLRALTAVCLLAMAAPAGALDYSSTSRPALLYDGPSTAAGRVAIAGAGLPLEVIVETDAWVKVRDPNGRLAWVEKAALGSARTVMVKIEPASVRQQPRADAEIVFRAARGVVLEIAGEPDGYGWLPVKHADGLSGWLRSYEVWGQ